MRVGLLAHERTRRDEIINAAEKSLAGKGKSLRDLFRKGNVQRAILHDMMAKKYAKLPLVSADYHHWLEGLCAWDAVVSYSISPSIAFSYLI